MKKVLLVSALVMTIVASMVSGTLAVYQINLSNIAEDSVIAKKFVFKKGIAGDFTTSVKIAPTESKKMTFSVTNASDGDVDISDVDMNVEVTIVLDDISNDPSNRVLAIPPLKVAVYKGDPADAIPMVLIGDTLDIYGKGELTYNLDKIFTADKSWEQIFTVVVTWDSEDNEADNESDTLLAGPAHGTKLTVSVAGTQDTL